MIMDIYQMYNHQEMVGFMTMHLDHTIEHNTLYLRRLLGYEDLAGVNFINDLLTPAYRDWFRKIHVGHRGLAMFDALPLIKCDGSMLWGSVRCFPIRRWQQSNKPLYRYFIAILDVTLQRRRELECIKSGTVPLKLSMAERAVAKTVIQDMPIKVAAEHLGLSTRTIENHRTRIRKKLQLTGSTVDLREALLGLPFHL
jgi:DNA-binding CsgD family transcriptional regulator